MNRAIHKHWMLWLGAIALLCAAPESKQTITTTDSLRVAGQDTLLQYVGYAPETFELFVNPASPQRNPWDAAAWVTFASPRPDPDPKESGDVNRVVLEWFPAMCDGKPLETAPAVLVLHTYDSRMFIGRGMARELAKRGIHALLMHAPNYGARRYNPPRGYGDRFFERAKQSIADARRAKDAIAALPGVDPDRISIVGISLGGFHAIAAAAMDDAFEKVFIIGAGVDLYTVLTKGIREARWIRTSLSRFGVDDAKLRERCAPFQGALFRGRLDPDRTWLFTASHDITIPTECSDAFAEAIGLEGEHHQVFKADHYTLMLYLPWMTEQIAQHIAGCK